MLKQINNFRQEKEGKKRKYAFRYAYYGSYQETFFTSYQSIREVQKNVKEIIFAPICDSYLSLCYYKRSLLNLTLGLANLLIGMLTFNKHEIITAKENLTQSALDLVSGCYFAVSIVFDYLKSLLSLMTHTLKTIIIGIEQGVCDLVNSFQGKGSSFSI